MVIQQKSLLSKLLQQSLDLSVLELDDLLLSLVDHAAECGEYDVPGMENEGHVRRRNMASVRCREMKSSGGNAVILRQANTVFYGVLASAEYFDPTGTMIPSDQASVLDEGQL